jgi:hypothetical protein
VPSDSLKQAFLNHYVEEPNGRKQRRAPCAFLLEILRGEVIGIGFRIPADISQVSDREVSNRFVNAVVLGNLDVGKRRKTVAD